jgi:hypothetical protein
LLSLFRAKKFSPLFSMPNLRANRGVLAREQANHPPDIRLFFRLFFA